MPRKTYTSEFKIQAVRMITDQGLSVSEVARRLGVGVNCVRNWRNALRDDGPAAFPGHGQSTPADDELRRLRVENQRLKAERDLLKKAAAYFASHPN
jgi:transposase